MAQSKDYNISLEGRVGVDQLESVVQRGLEDCLLELAKGNLTKLYMDMGMVSSVTEEGVRYLTLLSNRFPVDYTPQFLHVGREAYTDLMNSNFGGERIISLAEIYTNRDENIRREYINGLFNPMFEIFRKELYGDNHEEVDKGLNTFLLLGNRYEKLHGRPESEEEKEMEREYPIIVAQRTIEKFKKDSKEVGHLGYEFGKTEGIIEDVGEIPDASENEDMVKPWFESYNVRIGSVDHKKGEVRVSNEALGGMRLSEDVFRNPRVVNSLRRGDKLGVIIRMDKKEVVSVMSPIEEPSSN